MKVFVLVALSCFFVVALTSGNSFARTQGNLKGKTLYTEKCAFCHGVNGDGKGPVGEPLKGQPVDFTNPKFWQEDVVKKIDVTVKNGKEMMPAIYLTPDKIKDITKYITRTFKKRKSKQ